MATIKFQNGQTVNFNGNPTPEDVDFVAKHLGIAPDKSPSAPQPPSTPDDGGGRGLLSAPLNALVGAAKGVMDVPREFAQAGQKFGGYLAEKMTGRPAAPNPVSEALAVSTRQKALTAPQNPAQGFGFGAEKVAELFAPGELPAKLAGRATELAGLGGKLAENAPKLRKMAQGAGKLLARSGTEAAALGGQTYAQTGGDAEKAKQAAELGAAVPFVSAAAKGAGKLLGKEPERLMGKALGFTKTQVAKIDRIASENGAYRGIKDFALKHGFSGNREQMAQQIEERFSELTKGSKPELLANITEMTPNTYKPAFDHLLRAYDVPGQEQAAQEILALSMKPELTGAELDKVRSYLDATLPQGAYKGAEPVKTEGLQNLVDPIRRRLEEIDPSGTIRRVNQDIRVLYPMMDAIAKSKATGAEGPAAFRTMMRSGALGAAKVLGAPVPAALSLPYVVYQGATDFPQVASYVAQRLKGVQAALPENIPVLLRKALERWK